MDLEEANFILNQLTISQPCISGYMCITADQIKNKTIRKRT